jgi:hypothetical protein
VDLNKELLGAAGSMDPFNDMISIANEHMGDFNDVNWATLVTRLGKFFDRERSASSLRDASNLARVMKGLEDALGDATGMRRATFSTKCRGMIMAQLERIGGHRKETLVQLLMEDMEWFVANAEVSSSARALPTTIRSSCAMFMPRPLVENVARSIPVASPTTRKHAPHPHPRSCSRCPSSRWATRKRSPP